MAATKKHAKTEELLEAVFLVMYVPRVQNEGPLPLEESREMEVRCETVASR
jgi:hypothetical protein